jgi:hypothetical protein
MHVITPGKEIDDDFIVLHLVGSKVMKFWAGGDAMIYLRL